MLTPNYLWYVADKIVEIYEELNTFAIKDVCRRLISADWQMTETARYQLVNLMQSGVILQDIQEKVAEITHKSEQEVAELFKQSAIQSMKYSDALYSKAGYNVLPFTSSEKMMNILTATYLQTNGTLENFTQTIALATNTEFYKQLDKIYMQIMSGQSDYISAISRAVDEVAKQGIIIEYPSGARISVEAGVRRATVTGINQACCRLEMERMNEFEVDLVVTSQHYGARPSHAEWQGRIFSLSGTSPYPNFYAETGYGTGDGLGGWNCRHSFSPYFEGLSKVPQQYDITKNNEIYEKLQEQRRLERNIRKCKREIEGLKTSIKSDNDAKVKAENQKKLDTAKSKLKVQSQQYRQYCEDNHFKTQNERLRIAKTSTEQPSKTSQNNLTSTQNSGNIDKNTGFKKIDVPHSLEQDVKSVNPKYDAKNPLFSRNCQRCVCTYEAKRRGLDVIVKPAVKNGTDNLATIDLNKGFPSVFKNPNIIDINGAFGSSVKNNIEKQMQQFGDGSRAIIAVYWKTNNGGHVFMAEQVNGKTLFVDPQNGNTDVSNYFKLIKTNPFKPCSYLMRTDNLEFTKKIKDCCEEK